MRLIKYFHYAYLEYLMNYMDSISFEEHIRNEGMQQGEERLSLLNLGLMADKRFEDLEKVARDKKYREELYKEYNL